MGFSLGTSGQNMQLAGTAAQGVASVAYAEAQYQMAKTDAASERAAAADQAALILKATLRQRSAARAATAASGAKIDAFSLMNEQEILQAGETDAAMTILSGERRAKTHMIGGKAARAAGLQSAASSMFSASSQIKGWKGIKTPAFYDGTTGDFSAPQG